jgi:hypothetical protein
MFTKLASKIIGYHRSLYNIPYTWERFEIHNLLRSGGTEGHRFIDDMVQDCNRHMEELHNYRAKAYRIAEGLTVGVQVLMYSAIASVFALLFFDSLKEYSHIIAPAIGCCGLFSLLFSVIAQSFRSLRDSMWTKYRDYSDFLRGILDLNLEMEATRQGTGWDTRTEPTPRPPAKKKKKDEKVNHFDRLEGLFKLD